jgi:hypothetical protein
VSDGRDFSRLQTSYLIASLGVFELGDPNRL